VKIPPLKTLLSGLFVLATASTAFAQAPAGQPAARPPAGPGLTLTSASYEDGGIIPNKYTQADPKPISPQLKITNVPAGTQTFVLLFHDPDVAIQKKVGDVLHGLWFNIPGTTTEFAEGDLTAPKVPEGTVQAKNLRGQPGYMGPGAGAAGPYHHYTFELFALDTKLDLTADATRDQVMTAMDGHIVGKAVLVGRFHR
jgi:Raf kinase inhibitor-like YbhB/YbcL family protein